jgi:hypothetical protein
MKKLAALTALLSGFSAYADNLEIVVENLANRRPAVNGIAPGSLIYVLPEVHVGSGISIHSYGDLTGLSLRIKPAGSLTERDITILPPASFIFFGLTAQLPVDLPLGDAELTFIDHDQASTPASVPIVSSSFGLFIKGGVSSEAPAIAQNIAVDGTPTLNQLTNAAHRGQVITLWGTGLGSPDGSTVEVDIGGKRAFPTYAGPFQGSPGTDQINVLIPDDTPTGCYVPVIVKAGTRSSNTASISIADRGAICDHPLNLSPDALATLDAGKSIPLSSITFESHVLQSPSDGTYSRQEFGLAQFVNADATSVAQVAGLTTTDEMLPSCRVIYDINLIDFVFGTSLDAGEKIIFTGPAGEELDLLPASFRGRYQSDQNPPDQLVRSSSPPPRYFEPGVWSVHVPGGSGVPLFDTQITLPQGIHWTNRDAWRTIDPRQDQMVAWDSVGMPGDAIVEVTLSTTYAIGPIVNGSGSASEVTAICRAATSAGQVTLPAEIIGQIAAVPRFVDLTRVIVTLVPRTPVLLSVPLVQGGVLAGAMGYRLSDFMPVHFR